MKRSKPYILSIWFVANACAYTANDVAKTASTDGSYSDTTNAIAYALGKTQDGWVITVGSAGGSYNWSNLLSVTVSYDLTIQGASTNDRPTITSYAAGGAAWYFDVATNKTIVVKDFIFPQWTAANSFFLITGAGEDVFWLNNIRFNHNNGTGAAVWIGSTSAATGEGPYGLINQCWIYSSGGSGYGFYIRENLNGGSWGRAMTWGTRKAVYIEDCVFSAASVVTGSPAIDGNQGARIVFRHNMLTNFSTSVHGSEVETNSALQVELYRNNFHVTTGQGLTFTWFCRGGSSLYYSNSITRDGDGFLNTAIQLTYYRAITNNGVCAFDRTNSATQYLGTQQPGSGSVSIAGEDPMYPDALWGSVPVYYWSNTVSAPLNFGAIGASPSSFIQNNRDYFNGTPMPGYTGYTYPHPLITAASARTMTVTGNVTVSGNLNVQGVAQ